MGERPTLANPRAPIVVPAETLEGLSHNATICWGLVIPPEGNAELRMKCRRTLR
jgi:hypothetical protein